VIHRGRQSRRSARPGADCLWLGACRSELVTLDFADLAWETQGLHVTIRRPKTDQKTEGGVVAVLDGRRQTALPHLRAWPAVVGIIDGSVFPPFWKGGVRQGSSGEAIGKPKGASGCAAFGCAAMPSPALWRRVPQPWGVTLPARLATRSWRAS